MNCDNNEKKVVDSNDIISQKIIKIKEAFEKQNLDRDSNDGFTLGLDAEHVEELINDSEYEEYEDSYEDEESEKHSDEQSSKRADQIIEEANIRSSQIIAEAQERANEIINDAMTRVKESFEQAKEQGYSEGLEEGTKQGAKQIESMKAEVEEERKQLESDYKEKVKKIEPELIDVLLKIFSEVTKVLGENKKELIVTLVNSVMSGTEVSKNYIIKTSRDDAIFLRENKDKIYGSVGRDINIEIVEDPTMKRSQCLIDTDMGIFDCSLDIQLENLIDDIKILACQGVDYFN